MNISPNWNLRRPVTLRPIITTRAQTDALYRIYAPAVRVWYDAVPSIMAEYERTLSGMTTDSVFDLEDIIERTDSNAVAAVFSFRWFFGRFLDNLVAWHLNKFVANLKYATNVDLRSIIGPAPQDTLDAIIARNVALVRNVSDQTRERISDAVYRSLTNRTSVRDLGKEISGILGGQRKRALRIASDQTVKISAAMDTARANEIGLYEWEWLHSQKQHFRPWHKARDGKIYDDRDLPADVKGDQPGFAPFCFPSRQPIAFHDDVFKIWSRPYSGDLTKIVTSSNEVVECTPNHPILTTAGWKPAKDINVGDYVVHSRAGAFDAANLNVEERQSSIGDLFETCKAVFGSVSINGSGADFHGDGIADKQIDVVDIQGGLRGNLISSADQGALQFFLENALTSADAMEGLASLGLLEDGDLARASCPVSRLNLIDALLWRELGPLKSSGLAIASNLDALLLKSGDKEWSGYSMLSSDGVWAFSGKVFGNSAVAIKLLSVTSALRKKIGVKPPLLAEDFAQIAMVEANCLGGGFNGLATHNHIKSRVENVVSDSWSGHVYNLETKSGWYSAGSIAVHNCGCKKRYRIS